MSPRRSDSATEPGTRRVGEEVQKLRQEFLPTEPGTRRVGEEVVEADRPKPKRTNAAS